MIDPIPGMLEEFAVPGIGLQVLIVVVLCLGPGLVWLGLKKAKAMLSASAARRRGVRLNSRWFLLASVCILMATVEATHTMSDTHRLATFVLVGIAWCAGAGFGMWFVTASRITRLKKDDLLRRAYDLAYAAEQTRSLSEQFKEPLRIWMAEFTALSNPGNDAVQK